jgi:hypothetical protein
MSIENASTEFINASEIRFAYRWLRPRQGTPLLLLQHSPEEVRVTAFSEIHFS